MIPVAELLYGIDQRLNKLSASEHQWISDEDKLLALNEAQLTLIKKKVDGNNLYKLGLDGFKKRYQDLQFLVEGGEKHPLSFTLLDERLHKWGASLTDLDPKLLFFLDGYLVASKDNCSDRVIYLNAEPAKHADVTLLLRNSNYAPSFEYQETLCTISADLLEIYTDGEWITDKGYLSYIRYPKKMAIDGEVDFDGNDTTKQDCELEYYLKDELLDLTVLALALNTENTGAAEGSQLRANNNE